MNRFIDISELEWKNMFVQIIMMHRRNWNSAKWEFGEMGIRRSGKLARWEFCEIGGHRYLEPELLTRALCYGLINLAGVCAPCHHVQHAAPTNRPATVLSSDDTKLTSGRLAKHDIWSATIASSFHVQNPPISVAEVVKCCIVRTVISGQFDADLNCSSTHGSFSACSVFLFETSNYVLFTYFMMIFMKPLGRNQIFIYRKSVKTHLQQYGNTKTFRG